MNKEKEHQLKVYLLAEAQWAAVTASLRRRWCRDRGSDRWDASQEHPGKFYCTSCGRLSDRMAESCYPIMADLVLADEAARKQAQGE